MQFNYEQSEKTMQYNCQANAGGPTKYELPTFTHYNGIKQSDLSFESVRVHLRFNLSHGKQGLFPPNIIPI